MKRRIDQLLVECGFAESRHRAQALLLAGQVLVDQQKIDKPGHQVDSESAICVIRQLQFVSRAGAKLQGALKHFCISVDGRICVDLGASTGGFTDCMLQNGAARVHAFDVGKGQLAWKLQKDARVVVRDEFNVRNLAAGDLPEDVSFVAIDLSFISVTKVLPALAAALRIHGQSSDGDAIALSAETCDIIILVKPQFEAGRDDVGKGGIVRDPVVRLGTLESVAACATGLGFRVMEHMDSPLAGAGGNLELLLHLQHPKGILSDV